MALSHSPSIVTDGLVLCLDAANLKSYPGTGVTWRDLSTSGSNGQFNNGVTFSSIQGGSISFDGVDDYVSFANTNIGEFSSANFSYGAWFYFNGTSQNSYIMGKRNDNPFNQYNLGINNNAETGGNGRRLTAFMAPDTNFTRRCQLNGPDMGTTPKWCFGMVAQRGNIQQLYLDGSLVATQTQAHAGDTYLIPNKPLYVGAINLNNNPGLFFKNNFISVVFLYNRALSDAEILQNFNALRGRFNL